MVVTSLGSVAPFRVVGFGIEYDQTNVGSHDTSFLPSQRRDSSGFDGRYLDATNMRCSGGSSR